MSRPCHSHRDHHCDHKKRHCRCKKKCKKQFPIRIKNNETFVIDKPGYYVLCGDQDFAPLASIPAIQIVSDEVTVDLCGYNLRQTNDQEDVFGIAIQDLNIFDANVYNKITVKNGSVLNFTGIGVSALNVSVFVNGLAFQDLHFFDLNVLDCGSTPTFNFASGIDLDSWADDYLFDPDVPAAFKNVIIERCNVNRCLGNGSIEVYTGENVVIRDCQANYLLNEVVVYGTFAYQLFCRGLQMSDCQGNFTRQLDENSNAQCGGSIIQGCIDAYVKDCQFNYTYGESTLINNSNNSNTRNGVWENCQFNNATGGPASVLLCGVHLSDGVGQVDNARNQEYINCQFNGALGPNENEGLTFVGGFISVTASEATFESCEAKNIKGLAPNTFAFGFNVLAGYGDTIAPLGDLRGTVFRNCIASDIEGTFTTSGFIVNNPRGAREGIQLTISDMVFENCIASNIRSSFSPSPSYPTAAIAGISENLDDVNDFGQILPLMKNLFIKNCRVSDVRATDPEGKARSAGILVESVRQPVLCNNSVSDCDRGILFTGLDQVIPNGFQMALTQEDALAEPPVFVDLPEVSLLVTTDAGLPNEPYDAVYTSNGPRLTGPITALADTTDPLNACAPVVNDLTGKVAIVQADFACPSGTFVLNTEASGTPIAATLIISPIDDPVNWGGSPAQTGVAVAIDNTPGQELLTVIPGATVTIDTNPPAAIHSFENKTKGGPLVEVPTGSIDGTLNMFFPPTEDLTALGWEAGDEICYTSSSPVIPEGTYYLVVYNPGFTIRGLVQENKVDNCSISGYQDDKETTSSAWLDNTAFNNGTPATSDTNYAINWGNIEPVNHGTLDAYPAGVKNYNTSLVFP